ncbi:AMP-binding enzyme, partial [Staphylococcus arlettae]
ILQDNYSADDALVKDLQNYVKQDVAPYKYPREIEFVTDLPKTNSGKIRRVELREAEIAKYNNQ